MSAPPVLDNAAAPAGRTFRERRRHWSPMKRLLWLTLFLTVDLILIGSFVRVSDAGLGCPDWPGCYGQFSPFGAMSEIRAEMAVRPDGPVTVYKAWIEMIHRYIASGLGLLIIVLAWQSFRTAGASVRLALATVGWVILQGLFGMWTVTMQLQPAIVTAHMLGALVLLAMLLSQWWRLEYRGTSAGPQVTRPGGDSAVNPVMHPAVRPDRVLALGAGLLAVLLFAQTALGAWVSSNYATLACRDFPMCQGQWFPAMDLKGGFELWRPLGHSAAGHPITFAALTAIHMVHRWAAFVVLAVILWVGLRARRQAGTWWLGRLLLAVAALQVTTGLTNVFLEWPAPAAILHTAGAAALFGTALMLRWHVQPGPGKTFRGPDPAPQQGPSRPRQSPDGVGRVVPPTPAAR